jgi:hypothetical protein
MSESPKQSFEDFLVKATSDSWIKSYVWTESTTSADLRAQMGSLALGFTRTHKTGPDGRLWALDVEFAPGTVVGVDLELIEDRPILQNPAWLAQRFGLDADTCDTKTLLHEWVCREAVFKALAPQNSELMLSSFYKVDEKTYGVTDDESAGTIETLVSWSPQWVMALARRPV